MNSRQNASIDSYSDLVDHYYQNVYSARNSDEINQYLSPAPKDQLSNSVTYSPQHPVGRQINYSCSYESPNYSKSSSTFYSKTNSVKGYPSNTFSQPKKYGNSSLGHSRGSQPVAQSMQPSDNTGTSMSRTSMHEDQGNYLQNVYTSNCNVQTNRENQSLLLRQTLSSSFTQESASIYSASMRQNNYVSSIPTPPETTLLPDDVMPVTDDLSSSCSTDSAKMNNSSFVLPGSNISHLSTSMPSPMSSISNNSSIFSRNAASLQSPANLDEGSQASSASATSSLPDDQNSFKTTSKPNFSYPPTPNTLSSPGAASISSFHDDLECISSPGWPKTPASPVTNSCYEFANIKRPENLLKLYTLSDEPDRRYFLDKLIVFNEDKGNPITQCPTISKQPLDVFRVYLAVKERGGFVEVTNAKCWKDIAGAIGVGASSSAAYTLRKQYMKLLLPFECKFDRGGVDPQPIINMVEASSRKKGKNAAGTYGNTNFCNQTYPQTVDPYHSSYTPSYQPSRYPCNNREYQSSANSVHYSSPPSTIASQNQYNQYSRSLSNCGYYHGTSSSVTYNSNMQNNASRNLCRYGNSTPTTVPHQQEQGYYSQQYLVPQPNEIVQENLSQSCSVQGSISPTSNQISNDPTTYPKDISVINATSLMTPDNNSLQSKSASDSFGNANVNFVPNNNPAFGSFHENKLYCPSYNTSNMTPTVDQTEKRNTNCAAVPTVSQTHQSPVSGNLADKVHVSYLQNIHSTSNAYSNENSCSNPKMQYLPDYHSQDHMKSSQYAQFSDSQDESYRGSEGPPVTQAHRRSFSTSNDLVTNAKTYPCTSNLPNVYSYNYSALQRGSKDDFNSSNYNNEFNSVQKKGWIPDQNQYSYQPHVSGQRLPLKTHTNSSDVKLNSDLQINKIWSNSHESTKVQNKSPTIASSPVQNQSRAATKSQPHSPSMTVSQAFKSLVKRPMEFPPNSIEAVKPIAAKRRRYPAKQLENIDPWRIMLSLKSGLLAECTWALDTLAILLADNNTVVYFGLNNLPGLLNVLVDHYRSFLNEIFHVADDLEIKQLPGSKESRSHSDLSYLSFDKISDLENKVKILDIPNYTYKTRCKKKVEIQYDEALFLIDPQRSWDKYEGFDISFEHWQKGRGDITMHIQSSFDSCSKNIKFFRELSSENKTKHKINKISIVAKMLKPVLGVDSNINKNSDLPKGEPVVVLQKFNFLSSKISTSDTDFSIKSDKMNSPISSNSSCNKSVENIIMKKEEDLRNNEAIRNMSKSSSFFYDNSSVSSDTVTNSPTLIKKEAAYDMVSECETSKTFPRLRGSLSSRKRFLCKDLEDEAYCFDQPALCVISDSQEMLSRRCVCVSTILRNLSFVPGNDLIMSKNSSILLLLGRMLLLHHEHKPTKNVYWKYEKEVDGYVSWNESCTSLKDDHEWWRGTLSVLRDNTLVILSNLSGQLDLAPFPEEVSLPILDGLIHWIVCPSSYAQDPLPSHSPSSVLSPQRLSLEALCKLSVLSSNVDLIIATPPWSRIENLFAFLTKSLCQGQDQIVREFAIILLSNISQAEAVVARAIAEQSHCVSYLIAFIEEAEANAFQIAVSQGTKKLRDKPELMGTTLGMVQRAANILKNLALIPENRSFFVRHQARLLSLVMSQVMDQEIAAVIADVLFYCSDVMNDSSNQLES